ncbi:CoA-transferase family III domain-containing protein [Hyaloraphidium curvatum]|nr:CoA-transferase family III domain-containing protein [Hyaloraphidium curvatum]
MPYTRVHEDARNAAIALLGHVGFDTPETRALVAAAILEGSKEPFVPSPFKVAQMITGLTTAISVLANIISEQRLGRTQEARIDVDHAVGTCTSHFNVEFQGATGRFMRFLPASAYLEEDATTADPLRRFREIFNTTHRAKDGYIYFYMRVTDTPEGILEALGFRKEEIPALIEMTRTSPETRKAYLERFTSKVREWKASDLEKHMRTRNTGAVVVPMSREAFLQTEQGRIVSKLPPVEVIPQQKPAGARAGAWAPTPWSKLADPSKGLLHGIKYLELTRILMGPRIGCVLGIFNGNGIKVSSPALEDAMLASIDLNCGKRCIYLDLKSDEGKKVFRDLILDADVVIQNNTYGAMDRLGFGVKDVMELVKDRDRGIIYAQGNAFSFHGPDASAAGYEHLAQMISGIAVEQGRYAKHEPPVDTPIPSAVPVNILDVGTGHMGGLGILSALQRRAQFGGSYVVQVSLLQSALFLQSLGKQPDDVVTDLWKRYRPESSVIDPEAPLVGTMGYFSGFQSEYLREGHHESYRDDFFMEYDGTGFPGSRVRVLKPVLRMSIDTPRYRIAPRPFGFDKTTRFEEYEDVQQVGPNECLVRPPVRTRL